MVNSNTITLTVSAPAPVLGSIDITASPNPLTLGQTVTVTATVYDTNGNVMAGVMVYLFINGTLTPTGGAVGMPTNSSGVATFAYMPSAAGTDTIYVSSDTAGT